MSTIYCRILFRTYPTSASGRPPSLPRREEKRALRAWGESIKQRKNNTTLIYSQNLAYFQFSIFQAITPVYSFPEQIFLYNLKKSSFAVTLNRAFLRR